MMIFDLDPAPEVEWASMIKAARLMRERLSYLGLASFVKTTGGKGLHIVVPLTPKAGWETVKSFSRAVAESIVRERPPENISPPCPKRSARARFSSIILETGVGRQA
jgi:bifunctional non-homologous end joining protein LigD